MIQLWERKSIISSGHFFEIGNDVHHATLDIIAMVTYGLKVEDTQMVHELSELRPKGIGNPCRQRSHMPFEFEHVKLHEELQSMVTLTDSAKISLRSPIPVLHHFLYRTFSPWMRKAVSVSNRAREREITASIKRRDLGLEEWSVTDNLIKREAFLAQKEGIKPNYRSRAIENEVSKLGRKRKRKRISCHCRPTWQPS